MSLKTTLDLPLGDETAQCTIEIPLSAVGKTSNNKTSAQHVSDIAAAIVQATDPKCSSGRVGFTSNQPPLELAHSPASAINTRLISWEGEFHLIINRDQDLLQALTVFASRMGKPLSILHLMANGLRVSQGQTWDEVRIC